MSQLSVIFLAVVLQLSGFNGEELSVFSKFDNNNVKLGDPMKYEIVFRGKGDFSSLRAPQIGKVADPGEWKVDMFSVKTSTFADGKVFEYMMRPLKEGVVRFPALQFSFGEGNNGELLKTQEIPVSVRAGGKVVLLGTQEFLEEEMMPDGIIVTPPEGLSDDDKFVWMKACRMLDPELFAKFDFPVSKLNEASCYLLKGQWAKALKIYRRLEWRIGQTKEIERGIMCCISQQTGEKTVHLPAWRDAFRFVLKHGWKARMALVFAGLLAVVLVFFGLRRLIKALAIFLLVFMMPQEAYSLDSLFEAFRSRSNSLFSGFGQAAHSNEVAEVNAEISLSNTNLVVGESFAFEVAVEVPEKSTLHSVRLDFNKNYALTFLGGNETLADEKSAREGRVKKRFKVYARYDAPLDIFLQATINGRIRIVRRYNSGGMTSVMTSENSFAVNSNKLRVNVLPLDSASRPKSFSGVVGCNASLASRALEANVRTNDVVVVESVFSIDGFIPEGVFEGVYDRNQKSVSFRSYFVADGRSEIPPREVSYYDTQSKTYKFVMSPSIGITYRTGEDKTVKDRAVDTEAGDVQQLVELKAAPYADAPTVGKAALGNEDLKISDRFGAWVRVSAGEITGWMKK